MKRGIDDSKYRIIGMYLQGHSLKKLGKQFGCSHEWIRLSLKHWGVTRSDKQPWERGLDSALLDPKTWFEAVEMLKPDVTLVKLSKVFDLPLYKVKNLLTRLGIFSKIIRPSLMRDKLLLKVRIPSDRNQCWEWLGATTAAGYGIMTGNLMAHRVAFEVFHKKKIPSGMKIVHSCKNRRCINPRHLVAIPFKNT